MLRSKDDTLLTTSQYKNDKVLPDPTPEKQQEWYRVYTDYVVDHLTIRDVAKRFDLSVDHASRIIKWCAHQGKTVENQDVYKAVIQGKIVGQLQRLERMIKNLDENDDTKVLYDKKGNPYEVPAIELKDKINAQLKAIGEIRKMIKLDAQVKQVLANDTSGEGGIGQLNIILPQLNRGQGTDKIEDKVVSEQ